MAACKSCGAELHWVTTSAGRPMPCNAGQVLVVAEDGTMVRGYVPHWSTCPHADEHRRRLFPRQGVR